MGSLEVSGQRVLADLVELRKRTEDGDGAQRVAFTPTWRRARELLTERLDELPVSTRVDGAGNLWATLVGESPRFVAVGSHLDSVPDGGWLDGALGVFAGVEVLRQFASTGRPPVTVKLIDWADEEGARFQGHSLFGSGCVTGAVNFDEVAGIEDADGITIAEALAECGIDSGRIPEAGTGLDGLAAYAELHIEQGPVLEARGHAVAAVSGAVGLERSYVCFTGEARHAGPTPMDLRRDAFAAAARLVGEASQLARDRGAVATCGAVDLEPGIPSVIPGRCEMSVDVRHANQRELDETVRAIRSAAAQIASEHGLEVEWRTALSYSAVAFDERLLCEGMSAVQDVAGTDSVLVSGALHDAVTLAAAGLPVAMLFVRSLNGISHQKAEDSSPDDVVLGVRALGALVSRLVENAAAAPTRRQPVAR